MERPKLNFIPKNEIKAYARKCHCRYYSRDVSHRDHSYDKRVDGAYSLWHILVTLRQAFLLKSKQILYQD